MWQELSGPEPGLPLQGSQGRRWVESEVQGRRPGGRGCCSKLGVCSGVVWRVSLVTRARFFAGSGNASYLFCFVFFSLRMVARGAGLGGRAAAYEGAACHEIGFNWRQGNKRVKLGSPLTLAVNAGWSHCHYLLARCSTLTLTAALTIYSVAAPFAVNNNKNNNNTPAVRAASLVPLFYALFRLGQQLLFAPLSCVSFTVCFVSA